MAKRYFVRAADVPPYSPANHTGTINRRLIGPDSVGAKNIEVVLGVIERGAGAAPHASCYFPAGVMHKFTATSAQPVKVLVIYSPPYGESPERVVRQ